MDTDAFPYPTSSPGGSRKRQRTLDNLDHGQDILSLDGSDEPVVLSVRDTSYYRDDGDCIIRVKNTLFKVHQYLLVRDSSAFRDMFSFPESQTVRSEGSSDEDPIVLYGDTPEQFSELCWVLYSLAPEIHRQSTEDANISKLLTIAEITNKYHFISLESWSLDAVLTFCRRESPGYLTKCSSEDFIRLVEVAIRCCRTDLCDLVVDKWIARIKVRNHLPLLPAILTSDKYNLRRLQGFAYYRQLLDMNSIAPLPGSTATRFFHPNLSDVQTRRLLAGYWSLSRYWERLRTSAPDFPRPDSCPPQIHQAVCVATWSERWLIAAGSTEANKRGPANVLMKIHYLREVLMQDELFSRNMLPSASCRKSALDTVAGLYNALHESLAEHFLSCDLDHA